MSKMTELQLQLEWQEFSLSGRLQQPGEFKNKCIATYKVAALRCTSRNSTSCAS